MRHSGLRYGLCPKAAEARCQVGPGCEGAHEGHEVIHHSLLQRLTLFI